MITCRQHCALCLKMFVSIALLTADGKQPCYILNILGVRTTETPHYLFEMQLYKNRTLSSVTRVLEEVPIPVWHFRIIQHSSTPAKNTVNGGSGVGVSDKPNPLLQQEPKVLYNATYKTCDFWKYVKRVRVFNNVAQMVLSKDSSNMSLKCPLAVGTYVMRNMYVPSDTGLLKFMYWPNTVYTLHGTVYSQRNDKSLVKKCTYEINGTVLKMC